MNIVFHDDQHAPAIVAAGILNGLELVGKDIGNVKVAVLGAASIACLDLLVSLGLNKSLLKVCDSQGVIYPGRDANMEENKARYAGDTSDRDLADAMVGADIFIGVSKGGVAARRWSNRWLPSR
jgi:malate dehydrogenase (oxaloacetate-decarboxylating)(NADP+)